jgi:hypothetical protein
MLERRRLTEERERERVERKNMQNLNFLVVALVEMGLECDEQKTQAC